MTLKEWLNKWKLSVNLKVNAGFLEAQFSFNDTDKEAAWELYIELITRIAIQPLAPDEGDEKRALGSVYEIFPTTRSIIKKYGRSCINLTKIAVIVLNQIIRPFTAKWHKLNLAGALEESERCRAFRKELENVQKDLRVYTKMLADMIGIEDLSELDEI